VHQTSTPPVLKERQANWLPADFGALAATTAPAA